jgi:hypothetical protein
MPNFFRSFAIDYFFNSKLQLSAKKSNTPLFSTRSPSSPFAFLEVEELKHLSSISRTSILESLLINDLVLFYICSFCF